MKNKLLLVFILFFTSCQIDKNNEKLQQLSINPDNICEVSSSEIAQSISIIPLETSDECLLGEICKICCFKNQIYISANSSIYIFDYKGKFIKKIYHKGNGPEEYIGLSDFQVTNSGNVLIFSDNNQKIYEYDSQDNCVNTIDLGFWALDMFLDNENLYFYLGNRMSEKGKYKIIQFSNGVKLNSFIKIDENKAQYLNFLENCNFSKYKNTNYFYEYFCDTIYQISQDTIIKKYYFDFGDYKVPTRIFEKEYNDVREFVQSFDLENYAIGMNLFLETNENYFISYNLNRVSHYSIVNKTTNDVKNFVEIIENTKLQDFPIKSNYSFIDKNLLIYAIDNSEILDYSNSLSNDRKSELLNNISQDIEANPIIVIYELK